MFLKLITHHKKWCLSALWVSFGVTGAIFQRTLQVRTWVFCCVLTRGTVLIFAAENLLPPAEQTLQLELVFRYLSAPFHGSNVPAATVR